MHHRELRSPPPPTPTRVLRSHLEVKMNLKPIPVETVSVPMWQVLTRRCAVPGDGGGCVHGRSCRNVRAAVLLLHHRHDGSGRARRHRLAAHLHHRVPQEPLQVHVRRAAGARHGPRHIIQVSFHFDVSLYRYCVMEAMICCGGSHRSNNIATPLFRRTSRKRKKKEEKKTSPPPPPPPLSSPAYVRSAAGAFRRASYIVQVKDSLSS